MNYSIYLRLEEGTQEDELVEKIRQVKNNALDVSGFRNASLSFKNANEPEVCYITMQDCHYRMELRDIREDEDFNAQKVLDIKKHRDGAKDGMLEKFVEELYEYVPEVKEVVFYDVQQEKVLKRCPPPKEEPSNP